MKSPRLILVFVRYPEPGRVKTRLAATVGHTVAAELYRAFVEDILVACRSASCAVNVMVSEPGDVERTRAWLGEALGRETVCLAQQGRDLGERMAAAFHGAFARGFEEVILIGSDIPDLPAGVLSKGFDALRRHDAVLGPCRDGGYYLVGFRSGGFRPEVFQGVHWSTASVFFETCRLMEQHRLSLEVLPAWEDVDTFEDLERLYHRLKTASRAPRTLILCRKQVFLAGT